MKFKLVCISGILCFMLTAMLTSAVRDVFSQTPTFQPIKKIPDISELKKKQYEEAKKKEQEARSSVVVEIKAQFAITDSTTQVRISTLGIQKQNKDTLELSRSLNDTIIQLVETSEKRVPEFVPVPVVKLVPVKAEEEVDTSIVNQNKVKIPKKKRWLKLFIK